MAAPGSGATHLVVRAALTPWRLPAPVYRTDGVALGGRIFVLGGHDPSGGTISTVYVIDTHTGRSARAGTLTVPTHGSAAALLGGRILVFGGASTSVHDVVQRFDPAGRRARVIGHLPSVRADVTAGVTGNTVVLAGGFDGVGPQSQVWRTSDGRTFHAIGKLRQAVRYPAVVAQGGYAYVFGGLISGGEYNGNFSRLVQRVRISNGATKVVGRLPTPLAHAMGTVLGGSILVIGGSTGTRTSRTILRFDPSTGRVLRTGRLPRPLTDAAVATVGDSAYLVGGISVRGISAPLAGVTVVRLTTAK